MIRRIPFALCALLLSTSAYAQPRHHDLSPMRIVIETIEHSNQRYPTVGDWQVKPDGLHITVSKMSDPRYEFLIGMHEAIEAVLCQHTGISLAAVDKFAKSTRPGASRVICPSPVTIPARLTITSIRLRPASRSGWRNSSTSPGQPTIAMLRASDRALWARRGGGASQRP
jgi:hypothetical protein